LVIAVTASVSFGSVAIPPATVWRIVAHHLFSTGGAQNWTAIQDDVVWQLRMPRALLAALVGAGLAITGVAAQAMVRNPLADPYVLGISQGASVGAAVVITGGVAASGGLSTRAAAFLGALASFILVYGLARRGGGLAPVRLVLSGRRGRRDLRLPARHDPVARRQGPRRPDRVAARASTDGAGGWQALRTITSGNQIGPSID
jgi:iron complex transport system permease protein